MDNDTTIHISSGWLLAWLFTIGFAKLGFWSGALAFLIWPYYLGAALAN